ncbi:MAG: MFS transporter, partial [Candidatus Hodarchaeota archaeon]
MDKTDFFFAGSIVSFMLLVQLLADYPSGSLGDWIGQRWIMIISNAGFALSFFLLVTANNPADFFLVAFFMGFAFAQLSGTMETWLDNNYMRAIEEADPERKIYGFSVSRITSLDSLIRASAFIVGGTMATFISREHVFFVQACLFIVISFVILRLMKDVKEETNPTVENEKSTPNGYFSSLKGGIQFLLTDRIAFFFIMGTALIFLSFTIWGELILMPLYFGYTGSDIL